MSIKLRLEKGAIVMQALLEDDAFAELLATIQKHESKETPAVPMLPSLSVTQKNLTTFSDGSSDSLAVTKAWLTDHSAAEVLNALNWNTNPEKISLLGAHHEAKGGAEAWRSADMETKFSEAKEAFPGNFSRDIVLAIRDGIIATVTPRTYRVSRTGWNKIADAVSKLPSN